MRMGAVPSVRKAFLEMIGQVSSSRYPQRTRNTPKKNKKKIILAAFAVFSTRSRMPFRAVDDGHDRSVKTRVEFSMLSLLSMLSYCLWRLGGPDAVGSQVCTRYLKSLQDVAKVEHLQRQQEAERLAAGVCWCPMIGCDRSRL